jgi:hypothetical protein
VQRALAEALRRHPLGYGVELHPLKHTVFRRARGRVAKSTATRTEIFMRAEEGDENVNDYAEEAGQAYDNVAPEPSWPTRLWRLLTFWRST